MRSACLVLLAALGVGACVAPGPTSSPPPPPNFLILVTDDHPHDALGAAGHPFLRTPHMDALAARGVRFTHGFVTTPICAASRASIFTGRTERAHGYTFGAPPLRAELARTSYPARLRAAGYRTGLVGKLGVRITEADRAAMFDVFRPGTYPYLDDPGKPEPRPHLTERNVDAAIDFLRASANGPFCLSLSFQAPHAEDHNPDQYVWPPALDGLYDDAVIPAPPNSEPAFFEALPGFLRSGLNRERWSWRFDTPEKHASMVRGYLRMLTGVDRGIGRLVTALEELGLDDNTVIVLIGDNGYFLGERGYAGKWTMHDRSIRVPFVVCDPRPSKSGGPGDSGEPGRGLVRDEFVLNVDIAPTVLSLAGLPVAPGVEGRSLAPLLTPGDTPWRDAVFTEHLWDHERIPRTEGLRTRRWKYIRYLDHPEFEELYDLERDPDEARNLARSPEHDEVLAAMRARCAAAANAPEAQPLR